MIEKIKKNIVERKIKKESGKRSIRAMSFEELETVGIIFQFSESEENQRLIKKFVSYLEEHKKKVLSFCYVDLKEVPIELTSKVNLDYFCKADFNFLGIPTAVNTKNFIETEFDLLIDCNLTEQESISNIVSLSKSHLKIGAKKLKYAQEFDIQIVLESDKNLRYLLAQIDHYVKLIK
jgi:hypothetical protein